MAYRKTETILAGIEGRRNTIIAAGADIIAKSGIDAVTTDAVRWQAGVSVGLVYKYFPDKAEIVAAAMALILDRDLAAMREEVAKTKTRNAALAAALAVFFARLSNINLVRARACTPVYQIKMREEIGRLIRAAVDRSPGEAAIAAAAALGALYGMADVSSDPKKNAPAVVLFILKGIGLTDTLARRAVERA